jgi:hypothetical protein
MDDQGIAAAYLEALRQVGEFKTITVRPPAPVHKGDRITINLTDGRTYTGTVTSCVQIDDLNYDLTAEWDRGES